MNLGSARISIIARPGLRHDVYRAFQQMDVYVEYDRYGRKKRVKINFTKLAPSRVQRRARTILIPCDQTVDNSAFAGSSSSLHCRGLLSGHLWQGKVKVLLLFARYCDLELVGCRLKQLEVFGLPSVWKNKWFL